MTTHVYSQRVVLGLEFAPWSPPCAGDLDGNGEVGATDLAALLAAWGSSGAADLDGDGSVGSPDIALLLGAWGTCP